MSQGLYCGPAGPLWFGPGYVLRHDATTPRRKRAIREPDVYDSNLRRCGRVRMREYEMSADVDSRLYRAES